MQFHKSLTQPEKEHILDGRFVIVTKTEAFPATVKRAFAVITGQKQFALANPGEKYQVTDVVDEPGLPFRRLVFAGVRDDEWFIHYEHGGIGRSYEVVVFSIDSEKQLHFIWGGAGASGAKDFQELRGMVSAGLFHDDAAYYW
ncbi:MAG TPA: hypothetical protein VMS96_06090 [Terriglobales bacterium]|nr:hypothetical protein [Terriglobales bacterium]